MQVYLNVAQIILAVLLIAIILVQIRSQGGLGGIFGQGGGVYHARRGLERSLFRFTIVLAVLFVVGSILSVLLT